MKDIRLFYLAHIRFPTQKAHGVQIAKMCEAFVGSDVETTLVIPNLPSIIDCNPFEYYSIKQKFTIFKIPIFNIMLWGKWAYFLQLSFFYFLSSVFVFFEVLFSRKTKVIFYTRDEQAVLFLFVPANILKLFGFKVKIFWEIHMAKYNPAVNLSLFFADRIIFITHNLKQFYLDKRGEIKNKLLVLPDGADIEKFDLEIAKEESRRKVNLPLDKKIILYAGHLYKRKGAQVLADASDFLNEDCLVVFVGGLEEDIINFKEINKNKRKIVIIGHRAYNEIPLWLKSADVLVIPSSGRDERSKLYNSPMKLFEYMASKRPIVASDIPSLREILNESNSVLVEPDNSKKLAEGIIQLFENPNLAKKIAEKAYNDVKNYTWEKRVKKIINF